MLIGRVDQFAVEYEFTRKGLENGNRFLFGRSCLYIKDKKLGDWGDENLLGVLVATLKSKLNLRESIVLGKMSDTELKEIFENRDEHRDIGLVNVLFAENFDGYMVSGFRANGFITFMWKAFSEAGHGGLNEYDIFIGRIQVSFYQKVVDEFERKWFEEWQSIV